MKNITKKKIYWFGGMMYAGIFTKQNVLVYNSLARMYLHI
jgi:hypothetical protein